MYTETHQERKLIFKKSEIMCIGLGCLKDKMEDVYGISETNIMKILGIFLGKTKGDRMWNFKLERQGTKYYTNT